VCRLCANKLCEEHVRSKSNGPGRIASFYCLDCGYCENEECDDTEIHNGKDVTFCVECEVAMIHTECLEDEDDMDDYTCEPCSIAQII